MSNNNIVKTNSFIDKIPVSVLLYQILSYLPTSSIIQFSTTSKWYRKLIHSKESIHLWNTNELEMNPLEICIDDYCPLCSLTKHKGCTHSAFSFLSSCPLKSVIIHCFITDIPSCLEAISRVNVIERLDLQLTNRSYSPSLQSLLSSSYLMEYKYKTLFHNLKHLVLDSSHLQHINCGGRELLLEILGKQLLSLSFIGLSPNGVFRIISKRCPNLIKLRVDKAISPHDLIINCNKRIENLSLCRTGFILPNLSDTLPNLTTLRFSPSFRCEQLQLEATINNIPSYVRHLHLEIPSADANLAIVNISRQLNHIETLTLEGSYEMGQISAPTLVELGRNCLLLKKFELISSKSVTLIGFESQAFIQLKSLKSLEILRVMYQDSVLLFLPNLLRYYYNPTSIDSLNTGKIKEVILWHRKHWFDEVHWNELQDIVDTIRNLFPYVHVSLEEFDQWKPLC